MTTTAEAKIIDAQIADLVTERRAKEDRLASSYASVHYAVGDCRPTGKMWTRTDADVLAEFVSAAKQPIPNPRISNAANAPGRIDALSADIAQLDAAIATAESPYRIQPWARFFMVVGGHIHSSTSCHTLRMSTRLQWLPTLSGETEADAVAAHGTILCTHCYPTAPVAWTLGPAKKIDPNQCDGGFGGWVKGRRFARCAKCEAVASVTSTGKLRKHKRSQ